MLQAVMVFGQTQHICSHQLYLSVLRAEQQRKLRAACLFSDAGINTLGYLAFTF